MRVNINLASRKYEDVRRFFMTWWASLSLLLLLAIMLSVAAYFKWSNARRAAAEAHDLQQEISAAQRELSELRAFDNRPENRETIQEKQYWNSQIMKRSFSWTLLFNELQKIMPQRAYLHSVQPELTPDNHLKLRLVVIGERKGDDIKLIESMENSKRFRSTHPVSENVEKPRKGEPATYKFEIETDYIPPATTTAPAAAAEKTTAREGA